MNIVYYSLAFIFSVLMAFVGASYKTLYVDKKDEDGEESGRTGKESGDDKSEDKKAVPTGKDGIEPAEKFAEDDSAEGIKKFTLSEFDEKPSNTSDQTSFIVIMGMAFIAAAAFFFFLANRSNEAHILTVLQYIALWDVILIISYIDRRVKKIPTALIWIGAGVRLAGMIAELIVRDTGLKETFLYSFLGAVVGGGIIAICKVFAKNGVGMGDIRLFALLGFFLGLAGLMNVMFYTMFIAAITGIILLVSKKAAGKTTLAMAPFVFIGLNLYLILLLL